MRLCRMRLKDSHSLRQFFFANFLSKFSNLSAEIATEFHFAFHSERESTRFHIAPARNP